MDDWKYIKAEELASDIKDVLDNAWENPFASPLPPYQARFYPMTGDRRVRIGRRS